MAIYRNVNITFWTDTKVSDDFSPEDKYFMLYCLTNNYTNLCGCYEISIKQMSRDTGYNEETIEKLLERFKDIHKVIFYNKENKELLIKNWYKYNWTKSEKLDKPLLKEIESIKTVEFKKVVADEYNKRDTVSIPYIYPMDTTVTASVSDTVSETDSEITEITKCYEENIGLMTPATAELLFDYLKDMDKDLIIQAIKIASINNKRTGRYIQGILNDWSKKGFKTLLDVEQEQNSFKNKNEEKQEKYEHELTYTSDDFTPEQYDRLMRREMSKEEMIQILKEKKNV